MIYPDIGHVEIDPEKLFQSVIQIVNKAIKGLFILNEIVLKKSKKNLLIILAAQLTADQLSCLGLTTQRSTFITWDRNTGLKFTLLLFT